MSAENVIRMLASVIDAHAWGELPELLHADFACHLVHSGETFDGPAWVKFNAEYPGFQGMQLHEVVSAGERVAARATVTGAVDGALVHFALAQFATVRDGLVYRLTEVWTDLGQVPPEGTR